MSEKRKATIYDMRRYCKAHFVKRSCKTCIFYNDGYCRLIRSCFGEMNKDDIEFVNKTILEWCDIHPVKTYKDDFFEKFPNAETTSFGAPPVFINTIHGKIKKCNYEHCHDCWNSPMEEEE